MKLAVVRTGTANLASVLAALQRVGAEPVLTDDPDAVRAADRAVLPGVGHFAAARAALRGGLDEAVRERAREGRPLLSICLGLQLLASSSDEAPGCDGLAVWPDRVTRFVGDGLRVPQMGWNAVEPTPGARLLKRGFAYFANSYKLDTVPAGWEGALSDHGGSFVAAVERGPVLACQLHPELSGAWGHDLLSRWLEA